MNCGERSNSRNVKNDDLFDLVTYVPLTRILDCLMELAAVTFVCFSSKYASRVIEFMFCDLAKGVVFNKCLLN